ncbi:MAG: NAD(P)-binding domain-containing protein [Thermoanaerobaculia bacterium]
MSHSDLPVVVLGAGPVGLAAAAHLLERGLEPLVLEAGDRVGASVLEWGQVRMFSPWRFVVDRAAGVLLARHGWTPPEGEGFPTGRDLVERYLEPLAALPELASRVRLRTRALAVSRSGFDLLKTRGREAAPFVVRAETAEGEIELAAQAVVDASGTWRNPNPLGASGLPAFGEGAARERIFYGIPDVLGAERERYAGKRVLVVGSGHSALNALLDLAGLAEQAPATRIYWALRRERLGNLFGGGRRDGLAERGRLGERAEALLSSGGIELVTGFSLERLRLHEDGLVAEGGGRVIGPLDEIIATTGFRPDLGLTRELRLELDPVTEAPVRLAGLIDPNVHSCGTVPPHGAVELGHPEPGYFAVGMKSYGRAPTFLLLTGYEQARSVAAALAGDWEAARRVELQLPETGVCVTDALAAACCNGECARPAAERAGGCCS